MNVFGVLLITVYKTIWWVYTGYIPEPPQCIYIIYIFFRLFDFITEKLHCNRELFM